MTAPRRRLLLTATAAVQVEAIDRWWRSERTAAPLLFRDELARCLERIQVSPGAGILYPYAALPGLRRVLLRATGYHVYFRGGTDSLVVVHAVWHGARGSGPQLQ